ncbi:protein adenylyltransferase SelO [Aquimarina pacifica]|uniref:protein adenylyltransferase SelO n=1 Tax=Aquimarina pacifica TaxID=1296415 RepID=UPI00046EC16F|nr:YdiU family protein [Aquimarina pacifica]
MKLEINDTFTKELPADSIHENTRRPVRKACFSFVLPKKTSKPLLLHASDHVSALIGLSKHDIQSDDFLTVFTGNSVLPNTTPYAMCYGGHQFGNWAGQLGDGRAINLTEVFYNNKRWAIQLKGAGETPYSRMADGLAVLRSSIREYLCSEAMYHLGVPTTRALSLALTGDKVLRDILYNGNQEYEEGAIVTRVAPTFIRFGNFEILAAYEDKKNLKILADYTIKHFYPQIKSKGKQAYIDLFSEVSKLNLDMVIHWQRVGFVHGVMNTDNMSILGLTIDYGPYGWLEGFDPEWTPNTTDRQHKRYRFGNQPNIVLWNLMKLANALYPLIEDVAPLEGILETFKTDYEIAHFKMMKSKLGLYQNDKNDNSLISSIEQILQLAETDMTIFYRNLSVVKKTDSVDDAMTKIKEAFYEVNEIKSETEAAWQNWLSSYLDRLQNETHSDTDRQKEMNMINPKYVLRNYMAQLAIEEAEKGNYQVIQELYQLLLYPYKEQLENEKWFAKRPDWARNKIGCSMLSCSS